MDGLKDTALGRLASEIVQDIDMKSLSDSLGFNPGAAGEGGEAPAPPNMANIFAALGDNSSGLGKLVASVGTKLHAKMTSGELSQETLLQDAMKMATKLPGMGGGAGGGLGGLGGLGDIGKMLGALQGLGLGGNAGGARPKTSRQARRSQKK